MTPRNFLVRGLLAGVVAGFLAFGVAYFVGEPHIETAIAIEEAGSPEAAALANPEHQHEHEHQEAVPDEHQHDDGEAVVSRATQSTWGLLTATLGISVALGGTVALASAFAVGRFGRLRPERTTALVAAAGFVAVALVPFVKYPPNPPSVGDPDTLGARTISYFAFMALSIGVAAAAIMLGRRLAAAGAYRGAVAGIGAYLVTMIVIGNLMPTVNEIGNFPADTLWFYRRASLMTLATMWAATGIVLTWLIGMLYERESLATARKELAASI